MAPVDTYKIIVKEIDVIGEISQIPAAGTPPSLWQAWGRVQLRPIVTRQYDLDHWKEGFDLAATSNDCLRVAIEP